MSTSGELMSNAYLNGRIKTQLKISHSAKKNAKIIYKLAKYFNIKTSLEIGTSLGLTPYALALANHKLSHYCLQDCRETAYFVKQKFDILNIKNITVLEGNSTEHIDDLQIQNIDFVYFNNLKNKKKYLSFFNILLTKTHNNTVFAFSDIYASKAQTQIWQLIKNHPSVTVTIDCFSMGFVFFRKEQAKEHFKIRL